MANRRLRYVIEGVLGIVFLWWAIPRAADFGSCLGGYCASQKAVMQSVSEENASIRAGQDKISKAQQRSKVLDAVIAAELSKRPR